MKDNTEGRFLQPSEEDWKIAAVLIDCEGWIGIVSGVGYNRKRQKYLRFLCTTRVGMTDTVYVEWLKKRFGGGIYPRKFSANNWKDQHHWVLGSKRLKIFLEGILPFLKIKKRQAKLALLYLDNFQTNDPNWRQNMKQKMNALNRKGKPVTTNTPSVSKKKRR